MSSNDDTQASKDRQDFLKALQLEMESRCHVLKVRRGHSRGHLTVELCNTEALDVSALCYDGRPELTRVRVGSWIELTLATDELSRAVRAVATWVLFQAATTQRCYVWTPSASALLPTEERARFEAWNLTQPVVDTFDVTRLIELILSQLDRSRKMEAGLLHSGRAEEAAACQAERLERLEVLTDLVDPGLRGTQ